MQFFRENSLGTNIEHMQSRCWRAALKDHSLLFSAQRLVHVCWCTLGALWPNWPAQVCCFEPFLGNPSKTRMLEIFGGKFWVGKRGTRGDLQSRYAPFSYLFTHCEFSPAMTNGGCSTIDTLRGCAGNSVRNFCWNSQNCSLRVPSLHRCFVLLWSAVVGTELSHTHPTEC